MCERALKDDVELRNNLAALPALLEVSLSDVGLVSMQVVCDMASRPKTVTIILREGLFDENVDVDIIRRLLHADVLRNIRDLTLQGFQGKALSMDLGDRDPNSPLSTLHLDSLLLIECDVLPLLVLFPSIRRLSFSRCTYSTTVDASKLRHLRENHLTAELSDLDKIPIPPSNVLLLLSLSCARRAIEDVVLPSDSNTRISSAVVLHLSIYSSDSVCTFWSIIETIGKPCSTVRYLILRFTSKEAVVRCAVSDYSLYQVCLADSECVCTETQSIVFALLSETTLCACGSESHGRTPTPPTRNEADMDGRITEDTRRYHRLHTFITLLLTDPGAKEDLLLESNKTDHTVTSRAVWAYTRTG